MRCASGDGVTDLVLCCFAETRQLRHPPLLACLLQLRDRTDSKPVVECLDLFRAEPGQRKQFQNPRRKLCAQCPEIAKRPGLGQLLDLERDAFSNSGNLRDSFFVLKVRYIPAECFDRARCIRISPDLERIFGFQLQERRDLLQNAGDFLLGHHQDG